MCSKIGKYHGLSLEKCNVWQHFCRFNIKKCDITFNHNGESLHLNYAQQMKITRHRESCVPVWLSASLFYVKRDDLYLFIENGERLMTLGKTRRNDLESCITHVTLPRVCHVKPQIVVMQNVTKITIFTVNWGQK